MRTRNPPSCSCCTDCEVPLLQAPYWVDYYANMTTTATGLSVTDSSPALAYGSNFQDSPYMKVVADVTVDTVGGQAILTVAGEEADPTNHLFGQIIPGSVASDCGHIRLGQSVGLSGTALTGQYFIEGLVIGQSYHAELCYGPAPWNEAIIILSLVIVVGGRSYTINAEDPTIGAGRYCAGVRAHIPGIPVTVEFENLHWYHGYDAYSYPLCPRCGTPPECLVMGSPAVLPHCQWNEESGAGDFDTATLRTSVANARLITNNDNPVLSTNGQIQAVVEFDTAGDSALFILGWKDSSNYCYAKITCGEECGEIAVGEVVAGTPTETTQIMLAAIPACALTVCFDLIAGAAVLIVTPDEDVFGSGYQGYIRQVRDDLTVHAEGYKAGLAVGSITGEVTFYGWSWYLTPVESSLCEPCHSCIQHNDDFARQYDPPTLGCEWDDDTHAITDAGGGTYKLVLEPGETITSQITLFGTGVVAEVAFTTPDGPTTLRLTVGDKWAEVDGTTLEDSQGETDTIASSGTLRLCLHDGVSRATVGSVGAFVTSSGTPSTKVVSITNSGTEDAHITRFSAAARSIDDEICVGCSSECPMCEDNAFPSSFAVEISGVAANATAWGDGTCCAAINGAYYLEDNGYVNNPIAVEWCAVLGIKCRARFEMVLCDEEAEPPPTLNIYLYVRYADPPELWVAIILEEGGSGPTGGHIAIWKKELAAVDGKVDCLALSEILTSNDLLSLHTNNGTVNGACDLAGIWLCNDSNLSGVVINVQAI